MKQTDYEKSNSQLVPPGNVYFTYTIFGKTGPLLSNGIYNTHGLALKAGLVAAKNIFGMRQPRIIIHSFDRKDGIASGRWDGLV